MSRTRSLLAVNLSSGCLTTLNRSHEDAVRLTRAPKSARLANRVDMIRRIWLADAAFYAANKQAVDETKYLLLFDMALFHALDSNLRAAREALEQCDRLDVNDPSLRRRALKKLIRMPGASLLLRALRWLTQLRQLCNKVK